MKDTLFVRELINQDYTAKNLPSIKYINMITLQSNSQYQIYKHDNIIVKQSIYFIKKRTMYVKDVG